MKNYIRSLMETVLAIYIRYESMKDRGFLKNVNRFLRIVEFIINLIMSFEC